MAFTEPGEHVGRRTESTVPNEPQNSSSGSSPLAPTPPANAFPGGGAAYPGTSPLDRIVDNADGTYTVWPADGNTPYTARRGSGSSPTGEVISTFTPNKIAVPDGSGVELPGGHSYHVVMEVSVGKGGKVLWSRRWGGLLRPPGGTVLALANRRTEFASTFKGEGLLGIASLGGPLNDVTATLEYEVDSPQYVNTPDESGVFGLGIADSLRAQMQNGANLQGSWSIAKSATRWELTWPNVSGPNLFSFFTGDPNAAGNPFDALRNMLGAAAAWLVKWGPWIAGGALLLLLLILLPHIGLALIKAYQAWGAMFAAFGAL